MRSLSGVGRIAALGAVIAAVALVAIVLFGSASSYTVNARFINAGQLVKGNPVQTGGTPIGSVKDIRITDNGQASVKISIDGKSAPLRRGTRARIRQFSQSGIANRYIDLQFPPNGGEEIPDGGNIDVDRTDTAVDLDQLFNTLDPETRKSLQGFFRGSARQFHGRAAEANIGFQYLNPALATSSRLFGELTRDTPALERFLVDSSKLVTALAERRDDLAGLIGNLNETTRALGNEKAALAESIELLPPFMRRANTTFVNLRAALDDVDPLVDASKPVARQLGPFLADARALTRNAEPTVRDLSRTIRRPGRNNDLINLLNGIPPLADIAMTTKNRTVAPGGRKFNVGRVRGAFPETVDALRAGAGPIGFGRPYTQDLIGWFDDFSTTGAGFDALGATARAQLTFFEAILGTKSNPTIPGVESSIKDNQYKRCPGASEAPADDRSNVWSAEEQRELDCEESARAVGR